MSSREEYYSALERNDTVGARWKAASDNRASLPAADSFQEAVRLSNEHPAPFPRDPNAPPMTHYCMECGPCVRFTSASAMHFDMFDHTPCRVDSLKVTEPFTFAPFNRAAVDEWNEYLSQGLK